MSKKISIGEHLLRTQNIMQALSDKMPEIEKTINTLFEIKRQRKLRGLTMKPKERENWNDWDNAGTEQDLGTSKLFL